MAELRDTRYYVEQDPNPDLSEVDERDPNYSEECWVVIDRNSGTAEADFYSEAEAQDYADELNKPWCFEATTHTITFPWRLRLWLAYSKARLWWADHWLAFRSGIPVSEIRAVREEIRRKIERSIYLGEE